MIVTSEQWTTILSAIGSLVVGLGVGGRWLAKRWPAIEKDAPAAVTSVETALHDATQWGSKSSDPLADGSRIADTQRYAAIALVAAGSPFEALSPTQQAAAVLYVETNMRDAGIDVSVSDVRNAMGRVQTEADAWKASPVYRQSQALEQAIAQMTATPPDAARSKA